jgi:PAS domain S-box-containing protein
VSSAEANERGESIGPIYNETAPPRDAAPLHPDDDLRTAILDAALDAVVSIDSAGRIVGFNTAAEQLFSHRRDDVVGHDMTNVIIAPRLREPYRHALTEFVATGSGPLRGQRSELSAIRSSGEEIPIELTVVRLPGAGPAIFSAFIRDLSTERSARDALRQLARESTAARVEAEQNARDSLRYAEQLQEQAVELEQQTEEAQALTEELEQTNAELRDTTAQAEAARDLAERRLALLQGSEEQYRQLFLDNPVPMWLYSPESLAFLEVNNAALTHYGYTRADFERMTLRDIRPPEDVPILMQAIEQVRRDTRLVSRGTYRHRKKDGTIIDVEITTQDVASGGGAARLALLVDVTERQRSDEIGRFLNSATETLAATLDYEETLRQLAELAVPTLADYCVIDLIDQQTASEGGARLMRVASERPGAETRGRTLESFRTPPDLSRSDHPVVRVVRSGHPEILSLGEHADELFSRDAATEPLPHTAMVVPLVAHGRVLGAVTLLAVLPTRTFTDTNLTLATELARRAALAVENAELFRASEAARAEAEAASRAKTEFLAVMSHELRTPLNAILGYTDLMIDGIFGPLTEKQQTHLGRLRASGRHLLTLIEEILSLSRIEAGKEEVRVEMVDVWTLARDAAALIAPSATSKGLDFKVHVPDGARVTVTDPTKMRQILLNLLSNAVKFTSTGRVELSGELTGHLVQFAIRDTGPGIKRDDVERIFEPFWQVRQHGRSPYADRSAGMGLGLSVSRRLARLLGGEIFVDTTPDVGSTFTVRIPVQIVRRDESARPTSVRADSGKFETGQAESTL